jgi:hypothetical protein
MTTCVWPALPSFRLGGFTALSKASAGESLAGAGDRASHHRAAVGVLVAEHVVMGVRLRVVHRRRVGHRRAAVPVPVPHRWVTGAAMDVVAVVTVRTMAIHHHLWLLLLRHHGHVLLLRHGVPSRLHHLRPGRHAAAARTARIEPSPRHHAAGRHAVRGGTATGRLHAIGTHVGVAHRHAAHLAHTGETGAAHHVRRPHHHARLLRRRHAAHHRAANAGGWTTGATALLGLARLVPAALAVLRRMRSATVLAVSASAALVLLGARVLLAAVIGAPLDLHRDLVPAATLLAAAAAVGSLLVAPAGAHRHWHGLCHHLGVVVPVVVEALVLEILVVEVVVELIIELAAVVPELVVLGNVELDGLGVLRRRWRGRGERHLAAHAHELRRKLHPLHLHLLVQLLQLLKLLRSRLRHRHLCIFRATSASTGAVSSTRSTLGLALATGILGLPLAAGILRLLALAAAAELELLDLAYQARLGAPQLGGLASLVQLLDDGVRIHQAGHRHLPLLRIYTALVHTCRSIQHSSSGKKNGEKNKVALLNRTSDEKI